MAKFNLYKDGEFVNSIEAELLFAMAYCQSNGYTYEEIEEPKPEPAPDPAEPITDADMAAAILEGVNEV